MVDAAGDKDVWLVGGGDLVGQFHDAGLLDEVWVQYAPVTLGRRSAPVLPRHVELRLEEVVAQPRLHVRPLLGGARRLRASLARVPRAPAAAGARQSSSVTVRSPGGPSRSIILFDTLLVVFGLLEAVPEVRRHPDRVGAVRQTGDVEGLARETLVVGVTPARRQHLADPERGLPATGRPEPVGLDPLLRARAA